MVKQRQAAAENEDRGGAEMRSPPPTFKKYNAVVQSAELLDIRLTSSSFHVRVEYYLSGEKGARGRSRKLEMGGGLLEFDYVKEEGLITGEFEWSALSRQGRKRLLSIKSTYLVIYRAATDLEDSYVRAFLVNVGRFATFPYFRSLAATYSAAASADLPILPVLRQPIDSAPDEKKQNRKADS